MRLSATLLLALVALGLAGCDHPQRTVDKVRKEIADYKANPTDAAQTEIESNLAHLDAQIEKLETAGKTSEAAGYRATAENLRADYHAARMVRTIRDTQSAIQGIGQAFKEAGKSFGDALRESPSPTPK
ncbi:MAG: hypothetical protein PHC88_16905 [Terrimicrobiaceae bacterium]|nr:hypothetical protein [Terrimicrobiaceae bacterium]